MTSLRPTLTIGLNNFDASPTLDSCDRWIAEAQRAEQAGFDRLVVVDHVVMGDQLDAYDGGRFPTGPDGSWVEPLTLLALLSGVTSTIRLSTGILIAGLRPGALLAKTAASIDVASKGRLDLGVGIGWQSEEYEAMGLEFSKRGRLLDDVLEVCQALWTNSPATVTTETVSFGPTWCHPTPVQPGGVPLWISGRIHPATLRRMVRFGSGWIPWGEYQRDVLKGVEEIRVAFDQAGRSFDGFQIRGSIIVSTDANKELDVAATFQNVEEHLEGGVSDFAVYGAISNDAHEAEAMLGALVEGFNARTGRT